MNKWIYGAVLMATISGVPALADEPAKPATAEVLKPPKEAQDYFDLMIGAIEDKNYEGFLAPIDESSRAFMSKFMFDRAVEMYGPHLTAGYEAKYLEQAKKPDSTTYLWKLTFKDKSSDTFAILTLKGNKVAVFFFM